MSPEHADLLARIEAFEIDGPHPPGLTFAARLAREHGWTPAFAARVVREYKRFVFLALTAGRPVCPSEQVDAAWHLHLTYTRSYWQRFCGEVLGRPLHHDPTRGGPAEADKHLRMYADTLAAYRAAFGHEPPADVWPPAAVRFGDDLHRVAVNTRHNWVIPKAAARRAAAGVAAAGLVGVAGGAGGNPFDLNGVAFLTDFLWPVLVVAGLLGLAVRWYVRGSAAGADELPPLGWAEAAALIGGKKRVLTAAIARAVQTGAAKVVTDVADRPTLEKAGPEPTDPLVREVWQNLPVGKTELSRQGALAAAVEQRFAEREQKLREDGLLLEPSRRLRAGFLMVLPVLAAALVFGVPRLAMGLSQGKPVGYLIVTLIASLFGVALLAGLTPRRTRKGDAALDRLRADHAGFRNPEAAADPAYDAGMAVALFGTAALAGTAYAPLTTWYPRATGASGSGCGTSGCGTGCGAAGCGGGGGGGDGGGGGCGGGGCGGCGGGGGGGD